VQAGAPSPTESGTGASLAPCDLGGDHPVGFLQGFAAGEVMSSSVYSLKLKIPAKPPCSLPVQLTSATQICGAGCLGTASAIRVGDQVEVGLKSRGFTVVATWVDLNPISGYGTVMSEGPGLLVVHPSRSGAQARTALQVQAQTRVTLAGGNSEFGSTAGIQLQDVIYFTAVDAKLVAGETLADALAIAQLKP
jgi:hypothetical protein